ncbi:hypothetical protein O3M35_006780 [Rhynocoris fuscipes]|uniref:AB hydrolase-1 domain-containing protein n=1 Tax=Rhynocoris fuscipes TaxID=488301 RepID=A0AAW1DLX8_9HEMI
MSITRNLLRTIVSTRQFHLSSRLNIDPKTVEEVRIPVPWGHVAGKWWGNKSIQPILAIHGWLDNAGSFDLFAKELPENFSLLAIDVPGHGLSSHLPPFQTYGVFCTASLIKRIKKYYDFNSLSLLGHSGGSAICFLYSSLFPNDVKSYFGIDYLLYAYKDELKRVDRISKLIDNKILLALRDPIKARTYTREEATNIWINGTKSSLNEKTAEILMVRGSSLVGNGKVIFSRDGRLKSPDITAINLEQAQSIAEHIKCHVCLIKGLKSKLFDSGIRYCPDILNVIKKHAKSFYLHELDGAHHLHMDIPEKIVELYVDFVNKQDS